MARLHFNKTFWIKRPLWAKKAFMNVCDQKSYRPFTFKNKKSGQYVSADFSPYAITGVGVTVWQANIKNAPCYSFKTRVFLKEFEFVR